MLKLGVLVGLILGDTVIEGLGVLLILIVLVGVTEGVGVGVGLLPIQSIK
jgi:hypothetical protein